MANILADPNTLSRAEIKAVLRRHHGSKREIAKGLGLKTQASISDWLGNRGRSKRVDAAIRARAAELINAERAKTSTEGA